MKSLVLRIAFVSIILVIAMARLAKAQGGSYQLGARSAGMGNASVTLDDPYSLFNNIGGLAGVSETSVLFSFENRYQLSDLNNLGAGIIQPFSFGVLGLSAFRFGNSLFNEQKLGLGFSNKFGIASLGIQINYLQFNIEGLGNKGVPVLEFGGIAELTPNLLVGAHIFNINQAVVSSEFGEDVPTVIKAGVSYRHEKKLMINLETEKDIDFDPVFKAGFEYAVIEQVRFRAGITADPFENFLGAGFQSKQFLIDYAFTYNPDLGNAHQFSVAFQVNKQ